MTIQTVYSHDCTAVPITTAAYVELVPSTPVASGYVQFYAQDASPHLIALAVGAVGQEQQIVIASNSVAPEVQVFISKGVRLSAIALDASMAAGFVAVSLLG